MRWLLLIGMAAALGGCETDLSDASSGPAATPLGYFEMCAHHPSLCRVRSGRLPIAADGSVKASRGLMAQLVSVNRSVNATIRPAPSNDWTPGRAVGDCKAFAMTKRQRLIEMGWPSSAVPVAIVRTSSGEQHLIVVARTNRGDFVLDNLARGVVQSANVPYSWEKMLSTTNGLEWRAW